MSKVNEDLRLAPCESCVFRPRNEDGKKLLGMVRVHVGLYDGECTAVFFAPGDPYTVEAGVMQPGASEVKITDAVGRCSDIPVLEASTEDLDKRLKEAEAARKNHVCPLISREILRYMAVPRTVLIEMQRQQSEIDSALGRFMASPEEA